MWVLVARVFAHGPGLIIPWVQYMLFSTAVKKAGRGLLSKTPLGIDATNLLVTGLTVCSVNGLNFLIMLFYTDSQILPLISAGSVTAVTAFFLLKGFYCPRTQRERSILLAALLIFFGLFVFCLFILDVWWLALTAKLTLEVVLCFAVMQTELRRARIIQSKAVCAIMQKLKISRGGLLGKRLLKLSDTAAVVEDTAE